MIKELDYYLGLSLDKAKANYEQMTKEFNDIKRSYSIDSPNWGKPLDPQHKLIISKFVHNACVLREERSVKDEYLSYPHKDYTILAKLNQFEKLIKEFLDSFRDTE